MKKYFILSVLCFLWSCYLQGQFLTRNCVASDVKVNIEEVIWDATPSILNSLQGFTTSDIDAPASFHIVRLNFDLPPYFIQEGSLHIANIAVLQSSKPVVALLEPIDEFVVEGTLDMNGNLSGFVVSRIGVGVGGVATTAGVIARNSISPLCVEIAITNRISSLENGTTCNLANSNVIGCKSKLSFKLASTNEITNIYPNPVKDRLFLNFNELEFNEINIMNIQGEFLTHKVNIRHGMDRVEIDTSQLLPGIYLLEMKSPTGNNIKKFIVY